MYVHIHVCHLLAWYSVNYHRGSHFLVVMGRMVLAWVVGSVKDAFGPYNFEEALSSTAFKPLEPRVIGFGCLGGHGTQSEALCSVVVSCYWSS